jgi:hypothetical protein
VFKIIVFVMILGGPDGIGSREEVDRFDTAKECEEESQAANDAVGAFGLGDEYQFTCEVTGDIGQGVE